MVSSLLIRRILYVSFRVAAGSVCREDQIHSVVVGHNDREQRTDVLRINKPAVLSNISFFIVLIHLYVIKVDDMSPILKHM